jgi:acetyltransferase-like isoleucine patch superfamily enzyme
MSGEQGMGFGRRMRRWLGGLLGLRTLPRIRLHGWRGLSVDFGEDNRVEVGGRLVGFVRIEGDGNVIDVNRGATLSGLVNLAGFDNRLTISEDAVVRGQFTVKGRDLTVSVGRKTTVVSVFLVCQESGGISIGEQCMISRDVEIRTSDSHALVDLSTRRRINTAKAVTIGDHVWIGAHSMISKGAAIPHDSVVGAMSFVNKGFDEPNVVIAGVPARVVRTGVTWDRGRRAKYPAAHLFRLADQDGDDGVGDREGS